MGYIEDIKKINALAKELLQHNIVATQDEAVVKAREMLVKKAGPATVQNEEYIDLSKTQQLPTPKASEEWKDAMAKNNEYIVNELKSMKQAVTIITQEMQAVRAELASFRQRSQQQTPLQTIQVEELKSHAPDHRLQTTDLRPSTPDYQLQTPNPSPLAPGLQRQASDSRPSAIDPRQQTNNPKPQPHPRAGNYTPADVSVEKFFYFGKK